MTPGFPDKGDPLLILPLEDNEGHGFGMTVPEGVYSMSTGY